MIKVQVAIFAGVPRSQLRIDYHVFLDITYCLSSCETNCFPLQNRQLEVQYRNKTCVTKCSVQPLNESEVRHKGSNSIGVFFQQNI